MNRIFSEVQKTLAGFWETRPGGVVQIVPKPTRLQGGLPGSWITYLLMLFMFSIMLIFGFLILPLSVYTRLIPATLMEIPLVWHVGITAVVVFWLIVSRIAYSDKQNATSNARTVINRSVFISLGCLAFLIPILAGQHAGAPDCFVALILPGFFIFQWVRTHEESKNRRR